jgi:hypothetical protein
MELLGPEAWKYRDELEEVKVRMNITHDKFDCWIFKFLENKHFNVDETVAKLQRRADFERGFVNYEISPYMKELMRSGIMNVIGEDKEGRVTFYIVTRKDFPKSKYREERMKNFDMWLSYGSRLRRNEPRCRITLLINQQDASAWSNADMTFQTNIAFRIAKFYPGMIDRAYVCCMGNALSAFARPILKAMPAVISDRIFIFNSKQVLEEKKMLEMFDPSVLPIALGGENDCDNEAGWTNFAESVEEYFTEVKSALMKGMSVKEYEQSLLDMEEKAAAEKKKEEERMARDQHAEVLRNASMAAIAQQQELMNMRRRRRVPSHEPETLSVFTCESEQLSYVPGQSQVGGSTGIYSVGLYPDDEMTGGSCGFSGYHGSYHGSAIDGEPRVTLAPENIARHLQIMECLLKMEEQEALFRDSFYHQHDLWLQEFSRLLVAVRANGDLLNDNDTEAGGAVDNTGRLAMRCPAPARSATLAFLLTVSVIACIFFFAATVFAIVTSSTVMTVVFMAIFVDDLHMFPLGLALLIIGHQVALCATRGFELTLSALRGQIVRPLTRFKRRYYAVLGQFALYFLVCIVALAVFIAYSSTNNPMRGLRTALGSGMYSCAILLGFYHLFFPFGLSPEKRRSKNRGGLSLYLFLNITEDEHAPQHNRNRTSAVVVTTVPAFAAVLFGICTMISPTLYFIIVTVGCSFGAAFAVNHLVSGDHTNINGNVLRAFAWMFCVYWIIFTFCIAFFGWRNDWRATLIGGAIVCAYFALLTWMCYWLRDGTTRHRNTFRIAYASCLIITLIGVAIMFYVAWTFGLIISLLLIHSFMCFLRPSATSILATMVAVFTTLIIAVAIVLYAFQITTYWDTNESPQVSITYVEAPNNVRSVCRQTWPGGLAASDLALFNRLSYHNNEAVVRDSLAVVLPTFNLTATIAPREPVAMMRVYRDNVSEVTVFSVVPRDDFMGAMAGVTMWAEGIGLQPYTSFLPDNWTTAIVTGLSFVTSQFPLQYKQVLEGLKEEVRREVARSRDPSRIVLTGHSLGGGIASIIGAQLGVATVAFGSPGLIVSKGKFDVTEWNYLKYVTVINSQAASLSSVDSHGSALQKIDCPYDLLKCSRPETDFCLLQAMCGTNANRSLAVCGTDRNAFPPLPPPLTTSRP